MEEGGEAGRIKDGRYRLHVKLDRERERSAGALVDELRRMNVVGFVRKALFRVPARMGFVGMGRRELSLGAVTGTL